MGPKIGRFHELSGVEVDADKTDSVNVDSSGAVMESDYDAHTILQSIVDNTPITLTVDEQTLIGRLTGGNIASLTATQIRTLLNVANGANLYVHPDHSGDIVSSADGATTVQPAMITGKGLVTAVGTDYVMILDSTDNTVKKALISDMLSNGDMLASIYDPLNVIGNTFDMDNMIEGALTKILTGTERANIVANTSKLAGIESGATADQTAIEIVSSINTSAELIDDNNLAATITRDSELLAESLLLLRMEDILEDGVISGGQPATSVNLISDISIGIYVISDSRVTTTLTGHTYTASVDTYVDVTSTGVFVFSEVAIDAAAPTLTSPNQRLAKVVTDIDNIISVVDLRTFITVDGRDISIDGAKLDTIESNATADQTASEVPIVDTGELITATEVEGALAENRTAINLNTSKTTNVSTDLSEGTSTVTTVDVNSSDGNNATLVSASTLRAGLLTKAKFDEIVANTSHTTSNGSDHSYLGQNVSPGESPAILGTNVTAIPRANIDILTGAGSPVIVDLDNFMNHVGSVGILHENDGLITDEGATKFQVAAGEGLYRLTGSTTSPLISIKWSLTDILYTSLVSGNIYYIYIENVAGTPTIQFTTTASTIDHVKDIDLGFIWYNGENLIVNSPTSLYNLSDRQHEAVIEMLGYTRVEGAMIGEPANLKLSLTSSEWYLGFTEFLIDTIDTNVADTFTYFHQNTGVWTEVTAQTIIDVTNYNDTSSGLSALTVNRYGVHWVYLNANGGLYVVYGTGDYTIALAEAAATPASLPPQFAKFCKLVGKVIVQKGSASLYAVYSPFTSEFEVGVTTVHNDTSGLNNGDFKHLTDVVFTDLTDGTDSAIHYHATDRDRTNHTGTQPASTISDFNTEVANNTDVAANTTHRGLTTNPHSVTKTQVSLGNVENIKVNLIATTDPGITNDSASGYGVLSRWANITLDKEFVCLDASVGAAVWTETTAIGGAAHTIGGATHTADTLANLNTKVSDATLIDTADSRLSDSRTPTSHATTHVTGGSDVIANAIAAGNAGLMTGTDKTKLDGVEASAKDDQTASEVPIVDTGVLITATDVEGALAENRTAINLNTSKVTNVSTDLSEGTSTVTTVDVNSSDGNNATLVSASATRAGLLTKAKFDEIVVNNAKVTNVVYPAETATTVGALIGGAGNATPNDTDFVATSLTAGGILKKITWTNTKAFLKTYFDGLYATIANPTFTGEIGIGTVNVSETELGILEGATLSTTELNYVDGVTSAIQTQIDAAHTQDISFPAEAGHRPATNPAKITEDVGIGSKVGLIHGDFDDTTAEHLAWWSPTMDYDGGNIVLTGWLKAATNPSSQKTVIFDIYTVGIASNETYDMAVTTDTGVDMTFTILFSELMPNTVDRDFSGASAWANVDINAYAETADLTITATVADQYCTCPVESVPTTIGSRYTLEFDVANIVTTWTIKSFDGAQTLGTVTANGANQQIEWIATTTGGLRIVADETTSSGDFDNFSLTESDKVYKATATIDPANVADGDTMLLEVIRNVSDTLPGDGHLIKIESSHKRT